jgi:hypothetical protein
MPAPSRSTFRPGKWFLSERGQVVRRAPVPPEGEADPSHSGRSLVEQDIQAGPTREPLAGTELDGAAVRRLVFLKGQFERVSNKPPFGNAELRDMLRRLQHLERLTQGWRDGDSGPIVRSLASDFIFENPNSGRIDKQQFPEYFEALKQQMNQMGNSGYAQFMEFSEMLHHDDGEDLTAWLWYEILGTPVKGASRLKITDEGVRSDWLTFHAQPKF